MTLSPQRLALFQVMSYDKEQQIGLLREYDILSDTVIKGEAWRNNTVNLRAVKNLQQIRNIRSLWSSILIPLRSLMTQERSLETIDGASSPDDEGLSSVAYWLIQKPADYLGGGITLLTSATTFLNSSVKNSTNRFLWLGFTGQLSFAVLSPQELIMYYASWLIYAVNYSYHTLLGYPIVDAVMELLWIGLFIVLVTSQFPQVCRSLLHLPGTRFWILANIPGQSFHHIYMFHAQIAIAIICTSLSRIYGDPGFVDPLVWQACGLISAAILVLEALLYLIRELYNRDNEEEDNEKVLQFIESSKLIKKSLKSRLKRIAESEAQLGA